MLERILQLDHSLSARASRSRPPRWFRAMMVWASRSGDGWVWMAVGAFVLTAGGRNGMFAFWAAFLAAVSGVWLFDRMKPRVGRRRPDRAKNGADWRNRVLSPDRYSYPSGHTVTAFAVCLALWVFYPGWWPALAFLACAVGVSRVILGLHYPTDVLAGALIGGALGDGWGHVVAHLAAMAS